MRRHIPRPKHSTDLEYVVGAVVWIILALVWLATH